MNNNLYDSIKDRRSIYGISKEVIVSDEKIKKIIEHAVKYCPTAFNSQSGRVVLLSGENHNKLWDITKDILKKIVPEQNFKQTEDKINSFKNGYGTVLYFEDQNIVKGLQEKFPTYKDNFPVWSLESSGMLQYSIWMLLESEGLGVSLQHYNPLIDNEIRREWNIPENWKLLAQMPFGKPIALAKSKEFIPLEERILIL